MRLPKIERYNQFVWALLGTGFIVFFAGLLLAQLYRMIGWHDYNDRSLPVAVVDDNPKDGDKNNIAASYDFCQTISIADTPYQLIRIASDMLITREKKEKTVLRVAKMARFSSYESYTPSYQQTCDVGDRGDYVVVNVLVRNVNTGKMTLALPHNAVIYSLEYPKKRDDGTYGDQFPPASTLYWEIITKDSNGDGKLDAQDDVGAYLSDLDGRNLKRISPEESRVLGKIYDKKRNTLLITVLRDTNHDKQLNENDEPSLVESSVSSRTMIHDVLDKKMLMDIMKTAEPLKQLVSSKS